MTDFSETRIVLASQSPRRREIMETAGFVFDIVPAKGEEHPTETAPDRVPAELSAEKAAEVFERTAAKTGGALLVIGADTIVSAGGQILGKPVDAADACRMLRLLSGRTHQVYTGVTLILRRTDGGIVKRTFCERTDVFFHELTDEEIRTYVDSRDPLDKAGAYGIQGAFGKHIRKIDGDYYNVVGLPVQRIWQELKTL